MDRLDDIAGLPLWTIPPSDEDVRAEFIRASKAQIEELRNMKDGTELTNLSVPFLELTVGTDASQEEVDLEVSKAVTVLESMVAAAESGKPGQSILVSVYQDNTLFGFVINPETGQSLSTSVPVNIPAGMETFRLPVILGIMHEWSKTQNAVIAWDAVRTMNSSIEFPEYNPGA